VAEVLELSSRFPLLTLTGAPGVGKSRLAVEVARRLGDDGAVIVCLGWLADPDQVAPTLAQAIADTGGGAGPLAPQQHGDQAPLVVLDDCDRVLEACAEVAQALVARGMRVLTTAREPLGADGEAVWRVPPLSLPGPGHENLPPVLSESQAVQLFCERATSADPGFSLTAANGPAVAEICRRLDGIPLAIELAARAVSAYSPADIADRIDNPFPLLTVGVRTAHPRHHSLSASLAWSIELLSPTEKTLLERLAVFSATFSAEAAFEVCATDGLGEEEFSGTLRCLVDKSLVEVEDVAGENRYRLLGTIARCGAEKLVASGEEDVVRGRHARWCAGHVQAAGDPRRGRVWLARLDPYHDDIHRALQWALERGQAETAVILGEADSALCPPQGRYREAAERLERVVAAASGAPPGLRARMVAGAGVAQGLRGELATARARLEESVAVAEEAGDEEQAATAGRALAFVELLADGPARGLPMLQVAVAEAREAADPSLLIDALTDLGRAHLLGGEPAVAYDHLAESLALSRSRGDEAGEAQALVGLGGAKLAMGDYGEARASLEAGLEQARELGELHAVGVALARLGECARLRGEAAMARSWFAQAAEVARNGDHPYPLVLALLGKGRVALEHGDPGAAQRIFQEAVLIARQRSVAHLVAPCLCALLEGPTDPLTARRVVDEATAAAGQWGDKIGEALALGASARLSRINGDGRAAAPRLREALLLWAEIGDPAPMADSLEALATLAADHGDFTRAARLLGAAEAVRGRHGCVRPGCRHEEHASALESVREPLGEESFATEWGRGAALSTQEAVAYATSHEGGRVPRPRSGWGALTRAERKVAELAAQGRTNAEIAGELGVARSTVKAHLRRVFAKVGVETRTALAADLFGKEAR